MSAVPIGDVTSIEEDTSPLGVMRRRLAGDFHVDPWGLDSELARWLVPLARLRWKVDIVGRANLPDTGPAVIVYTRRFGISEPLVLAHAVHRATRRIVRLAAEWEPPLFSPPARRLGVVPARPRELAGLLRRGEIVALGARPDPLHGVGEVDSLLLAPATEVRVPVIPIAVTGWEPGWRWKVVVGGPMTLARAGGALAASHLAEQAQACLMELAGRDHSESARHPT